MNVIEHLRSVRPNIIILGSHPGIVQSILDFDSLSGNSVSVVAIIGSGKKLERYFFSGGEITIPVYKSLDSVPLKIKNVVNTAVNVQSARRVLSTVESAISELPSLVLMTLFAEQVPEQHAIKIHSLARKKGLTIIGPSSVGMIVPGAIKLGAIGGSQPEQIAQSGVVNKNGSVAVISTSGGVVNEIINTVHQVGLLVSFAVAIGGDRFPATTMLDAVLMAERDTSTKIIVLFGELGGQDE